MVFAGQRMGGEVNMAVSEDHAAKGALAVGGGTRGGPYPLDTRLVWSHSSTHA